jgi:cell division protein FtsW
MSKSTSILAFVVLILCLGGLVMLYSASVVLGQQGYGDPYFFIKRQLVAAAVGLAFCLAAIFIHYPFWRRLVIPLSILSVVLLVMAITPELGIKVKGSSRWLRVGTVNFQPSEVAKFAVIVLMASWMSRVQHRAEELKFGLIIPGTFMALIMGLIFIEPDFGTTMLIAAVGMLMMYVGGTRPIYLVVAGVFGLCAFALAVFMDEVRYWRVMAFTNPEEFELTYAYQLMQALYAFVVGGPTGVGLGQSLQKQAYLPEAHTDYIFAIIGEEMGLIASLSVVALFVVLFICGVRISFTATDRFGKLLALGITLMLTLQAAINISVVTGSIPPKGLPLPFVSFGGSSLVVSMFMIGVLINVALRGDRTGGDETQEFFDNQQHSG